ncbi:hypothetical protein ACFW9N_02010 [Streptomyces sp. NPDC059496]|uniref:hypothetical protein n=1 Tax=Streptomyces sp. NPDC059496 TaxID=3346851 RepID=UPI0036ACD140
MQQRIERARYLLETADWPVDTVAARTGLGTGASLRQHLRTAIGVSPHAYRRTFRATHGTRPAPEARSRGAGHDGVAGEVGPV